MQDAVFGLIIVALLAVENGLGKALKPVLGVLHSNDETFAVVFLDLQEAAGEVCPEKPDLISLVENRDIHVADSVGADFQVVQRGVFQGREMEAQLLFLVKEKIVALQLLEVLVEGLGLIVHEFNVSSANRSGDEGHQEKQRHYKRQRKFISRK